MKVYALVQSREGKAVAYPTVFSTLGAAKFHAVSCNCAPLDWVEQQHSFQAGEHSEDETLWSSSRYTIIECKVRGAP